MYKKIEPCSDSGAFVTYPEKKIKLDMGSLQSLVKESDYRAKFLSEVIILIEDPEENVEIGIYPSGKLLFKTADESQVEGLFDRVIKLIKKLV